MLKIYFFRHGETQWALSGQHSGRADLALTTNGEDEARQLGEKIQSIRFSHVFSSPLRRAQETCSQTGLLHQVEIDDDLSEWDSGDYEGKTEAEILAQRPDWNLFRDGFPNGETPTGISERADRLISKLKALDGDIALFSHGDFGRVLAARWIGLAVEHAQNFLLNTASISVLSYESDHSDQPVIVLWNSVGLDVTTETLNAKASVPTAIESPAIAEWENEGGEIPVLAQRKELAQ